MCIIFSYQYLCVLSSVAPKNDTKRILHFNPLEIENIRDHSITQPTVDYIWIDIRKN